MCKILEKHLFEKQVGVIGASGLVGECLLARLTEEGWQVAAFSRTSMATTSGSITWYRTGADNLPRCALWVSTAPIWLLHEHFDQIKACGAKRIVVLSSTSRFTKADSTDPGEQAAAALLAEGENRLQTWAKANGIEWVILRPTLIYGGGRDKNVSALAGFVRRFGFLPLLGKASGKRQPVRAIDVASACLAALTVPAASNHAYNIPGGETLTYREMAQRIFRAQGRRPRIITIPIGIFRLMRPLGHLLPQRLRWLVAMMERMNQDLAFDDSPARRDLGYQPENFDPPR